MNIKVASLLRELLACIGNFVSGRNKLDRGQFAKAAIEPGSYLPGIVLRNRKRQADKV